MERYSELLSLKLDCGDTDSFCGDYKQLREERTKKAMIEDDANKILAQFTDDEEKRMFNYALMHYNSASLYPDIYGGVYDNVEMKDDILDFVNYHVKMSFRNIISSQECKLDAINETYLYMAFKSEKKVLFTHGMGDNEKDGTDEINCCLEKSREYLKNRKKSDLKTPFAIPSNVNKKTKISIVGCGIVRTWLSSTNFRNFFNKDIDDEGKCEWEFVQNLLENEKSLLINLNQKQDYWQVHHPDCAEPELDNIMAAETEKILLEKIFGFNTILCYRKYILPYVEAFSESDFDAVKKLMKQVMKFKGNFGRCALLEAMGRELCLAKYLPADYRKKLIVLYTGYLSKYMMEMNNDYDAFILTYARDHLRDINYELKYFWKKRYAIFGLIVGQSDGKTSMEPVKYYMGTNSPSDYDKSIEGKKILDKNNTTRKIIPIIIGSNLIWK